MATSSTYVGDSSISIGEILSRAFAVMRDNPATTFGIAFLFGALPQLVYKWTIGPVMLQSGVSAFTIFGMTLLSAALFLFFSMLVQASLVHATLAYSQGQRATFGECISSGLSSALPLMGMSLLLAVALGLGFMLLLVPGFILLVMWAVITPVFVIERTGVIDAFGRSRFLTKGARWRIFGLFLILIVVAWLVLLVVGAMLATSAASAPSRTFLIGYTVAGTFTSAFWATLQTSLYISLRNWKEGPQNEQLADIFA